mmetsp:Transcript_17298/g.58455  ORF Transcript_17298/g.58455 Transcript_17298/m.58455 type:complete len:338 (-) Transcript_17298:322-1335(-)
MRERRPVNRVALDPLEDGRRRRRRIVRRRQRDVVQSLARRFVSTQPDDDAFDVFDAPPRPEEDVVAHLEVGDDKAVEVLYEVRLCPLRIARRGQVVEHFPRDGVHKLLPRPVVQIHEVAQQQRTPPQQSPAVAVLLDHRHAPRHLPMISLRVPDGRRRDEGALPEEALQLADRRLLVCAVSVDPEPSLCLAVLPLLEVPKVAQQPRVVLAQRIPLRAAEVRPGRILVVQVEVRPEGNVERLGRFRGQSRLRFHRHGRRFVAQQLQSLDVLLVDRLSPLCGRELGLRVQIRYVDRMPPCLAHELLQNRIVEHARRPPVQIAGGLLIGQLGQLGGVDVD